MPYNNKHITIIMTHNMNKQINSQLIDSGNEQWRRKGGTLSTHRLSCHPQYTWDRLSDCTILSQACCTVLHKHIHYHRTNSGGSSATYLIVNYDEVFGFCAVNLQHSVFGLRLIGPHQKVPLRRHMYTKA